MWQELIKGNDMTKRFFPSAEYAWLWTCRSLRKAPGAASKEKYPCTPEDILRIIGDLHYRSIIHEKHARILRIYGDKQQSPVSGADKSMWDYAIRQIQRTLIKNGLVRENRSLIETTWGKSHGT